MRWAMFSSRPVDRSSRTATSSPRSRRASARCDPMKPAPPVIRARIKMISLQKTLKPSDDGHARAVSAERAASEPLIGNAAARHFERPRRVDAEGGFRSRIASQAERRAEIVALCTQAQRHPKANAFADLQVRIRGEPVVLVTAGIVVTVVEIRFRAELRDDEPEIEIQAF